MYVVPSIFSNLDSRSDRATFWFDGVRYNRETNKNPVCTMMAFVFQSRTMMVVPEEVDMSELWMEEGESAGGI